MKLIWRDWLLKMVASAVLLISSLLMASLNASPALANPGAESGGGAPAKSAQPVYVTPRLIANVESIKPGQEFMLGVSFDIVPGWHVYYKEPGDAGMPTRIEWKLPTNFKNGPLLWQKPVKFDDSGVTTYGYHDKTFIAAKIMPPADLPAGTPVSISADLNWLSCKQICLPGKLPVKLDLPVAAAEPKKINDELFNSVGFDGPVSELKMDGEGGSSGTTPGAVGAPGDASTGSSSSGEGTPDTTGGSILDRKWEIQGEDDKAASPFTILISALLGGLILNLMPCVLPVISIKILSFMEQANEAPARVRNLGLIFSAGIISAFMVLAGVVLAVRAAGNTVGWGFQFQYPGFIIVMCVIVLLLAMSLFGVFYVSLSAGQQKLDSLASKEGYTGTFFKGVLATTLSTPCTAPLLGTALGFAFAQPDWVVLAIFFAAGLGMSLPYIVLTMQPAWMKKLPKPGAWMEKFKESMGFLLVATVVWLLGVLGSQVGAEGAMWTGMFLTTVALAAWIVGRFTDLTSTTSRKAKVWSVAAVVSLAGLYLFVLGQPTLLLPLEGKAIAKSGSDEPVAAGAIPWQRFTQKALDQAISEGKTVFLDFTADWCLTCKTNEKLFLNTKEVAEKIRELNIVPMKADWTSQDPEITKLLGRFNRAGVPLYTVFPSREPTKPIRLPEVVTQDMILKALDRGGPSK